MELAQDRVQWRALVFLVFTFGFCYHSLR